MIGKSKDSSEDHRPENSYSQLQDSGEKHQIYISQHKQIPSFFELLKSSVEFVPQTKIFFNIEAQEYKPESSQKYSIEEILGKIEEFSRFEDFKKLNNALHDFSHRKVKVFKVFNKGHSKKMNKGKREYLRTEEFKPVDIEKWRKGRNLEEEKIHMQSLATTLKLSINHEENEKLRRKIKATLNKLSPSNCERLQVELATLAKNSKEALSFLIENIFEKAWAEPKYTEMYARLCKYLKVEFNNFLFDGISPTKKNTNWFRYILLNVIEKAFEDSNLSNKNEDEYSRVLRRKKSHGSVRFIGELLKVRIITPKIIQDIIETLLALRKPAQVLDSEKLEVACVMISTMGVFNEKKKLVEESNKIFDYLANILATKIEITPQVKFKIMDLIDERKSGWVKDQSELPKTVEEIRNEFNSG